MATDDSSQWGEWLVTWRLPKGMQLQQCRKAVACSFFLCSWKQCDFWLCQPLNTKLWWGGYWGTRKRQVRELEFQYNQRHPFTKWSIKKKKKKAQKGYSVKRKINPSRFPANPRQRVKIENTAPISLIEHVMLHESFPKPSNDFSWLSPKRGFSSNSIAAFITKEKAQPLEAELCTHSLHPKTI